MVRIVTNETKLVRMRRPDGRKFLLRVPAEHVQRVEDLADGELGDRSIILDERLLEKK